MNLLDLMIKVGIDDQASGGIDAIVDKAKSMGSAIQSGISAALSIGSAAVAGAAAGVTALTSAAVNSYADYEQLVGGVETLFKDSAQIIKDYADEAFYNAGASANKYMEMATGFSAILVQNAGGDTAAAAELANTAIEDMSDNANKFGTRLETVQKTYESLSRGAYMLLDNLKLGYGGTMGEMARLLNDANKIDSTILGAGVELATSGKNILEGIGFDQVIRAIHVIQENIGITGTTVQEAERTITGSATMVKAAWSDMLTAMADENADFGAALDKLAYSVGAAFSNLVPRIEQSLVGIADFVKEVAPLVIEELPGMVSEVLPAMIEAIKAVGKAAVTAVREIAGELVTELTAVFYEFTGIDLTPLLASLSEVGLLLRDTIGGMLEGVDLAAVSSAVNGFLTGLAGAISAVVAAVQGDTFRGFVYSLMEMLKTIGGSLLSALKPAADGIKELFKAFLSGDSGVIQSIADAFGAFAEWFDSTLAPIIGAVASAVVALLEPFVESVAPIIKAITQALGTLFGWFDPVRSEAAGKLADAVVRLLSVFVDGLAVIIRDIADAVITFGGSLLNQTSAVSGFAGGLASVVEYFTGILENVGYVGEKISEIILGLSDLDTTWQDVWSGLGEAVGAAVFTIVDAIDDLITKLSEKMGQISGILENTGFSQLMSLFDGTFVDDLNTKITDFGKAAWDKATGFVGNLNDKITQFGEDAADILSFGNDMSSGYWDAYYKDRSEDINDAKKTVAASQSTGAKVTEEAVNAVIQSVQQGGGKTANINLNLDGRTVASAVYDPLNDIIRQKGAK